MQGNTLLTSKLSTPVLVDAASGELTAVAEMPWYLAALELSRPLHFGDMPLKILWALLSDAGAGDWIAWLTLAVPVAVCVWYSRR